MSIRTKMILFVVAILLLSTLLMIFGAVLLNTKYFEDEIVQRFDVTANLVQSNLNYLIKDTFSSFSIMNNNRETTRELLVGLSATSPKRIHFYNVFFSFANFAKQQSIFQWSLHLISSNNPDLQLYSAYENGNVYSFSTQKGQNGQGILTLESDNYGFIYPKFEQDNQSDFSLPLNHRGFTKDIQFFFSHNHLFMDFNFPLVNQTMGQEKNDNTGFAYVGLEYGVLRAFIEITPIWLKNLEQQTKMKLDIHLQNGQHVLGDIQIPIQTPTPNELSISFKRQLNEKNYISAIFPFEFNNTTLGFIVTSIQNSVLINQKMKTAMTLLIIGLVIMLCAIVLVLVFVYFLVRPILMLEKNAEHIAKGDLSYPVIINTKDEIGKLSKSFDHMRQSIKAYINRIEKQNKQLKKAEERYRSIFENALAGIYQSTIEGQIINSNPVMAKILGYENCDELASHMTNIYSQIYVNPEDSKKYINLLMDNNQVIQFETQIYQKDGNPITVLQSGRLVRDDNRDVLYHEGSMIDITAKEEKKKAERDKEAAELATKTKSQFLANMSHEIRTPMNAIIGLSNLALRTDLTLKQRDYLTKIEHSAQNLLGLINDILDFSKIEAGKLSIESIEFNLDDVLNHLSGLISAKADKKDLELLFNVESDVPVNLVGDQLRLSQVLTNLCTNAVKFTKKGQILLQISKINDNAFLDHQEIMLNFIVKDTGIGITPEQLSYLFKAFSQADLSTTRKYGGTGLGLIISKRLVEMMGGEINVTSEYGKGSNFSFTAIFKLGSQPQELTTNLSQDLKNMRILIVDDNPAARTIMGNILESFSFDVSQVASGKEAIVELEQSIHDNNPFKLVIMDWKMPGMNGIQVVKQIKKNKMFNQVPHILMVSAYDQEDIIKQGKQVGISEFLSKPVNRSLLFDSIMKIFNKPQVSQKNNKRSKYDSNKLKGIQGAKILLVEDNEINQQIVLELLKIVNFNVSIANNGREAVDMIFQFNANLYLQYDVILMDIQMPIMDGYEATYEIRKRYTKEDLPIIALTAHALTTETSKCIEAGMNDFVTKPIDIQKLFDALIQWIKPGLHKQPIQDNSPIQEKNINLDDTFELPDHLDGIQINEGLNKIEGNKKLYQYLLLTFHQKYHDGIQTITNLLNEKKYESAIRLVHTIKGLAGSLGANQLYKASEVIEISLKEEKYDDIEHILSHFSEQLDIIIMSIGSIMPSNVQPKKDTTRRTVNKEKAHPLLIELEKVLETDLNRAIEIINQLKPIFHNSTMHELFEQVVDHIEDFDQDEALEDLKKIVKQLAL